MSMSFQNVIYYFLFSLISLSSFAQNLQIGNHFGKVQNGLSIIVDNQSAVNLRFGWYENGSYENFYDNLTEETYYKGAHSPNYEYVESYWYSDGRKVSFVWGLYNNELIGFLKADKEIRFHQ